MKVPLTISDFLRRGALVYPDRPALIDEPGTAGSLGTITYRSLERRARGLAIALDEMGVGLGERVAIVSPNAARVGIAFYGISRSEEHTSELQSLTHLVCRLLLYKKKQNNTLMRYS